MEFHIASAGIEETSVPEEEVRRRIANRLVQETDICWAEGWAEWKPLGEVFADEFRALALESEPVVGPPPAPVDTSDKPLPRRRDHTSSAIFLIAGLLVGGAALAGIIWMEIREQPDAHAGPQKFVGPKTSTEFIGTHLEQVAQACLAYAATHGGKLPSYSAQLEPLFGGRFEIVMDVPETKQIETTGYVLRLGLDTSMPPDTPIAFEARAREDGSRAVAYLNGRVRVFQRGDPRLAEAIRP